MKAGRIILVGNGPSALKRPLGSVIDTYDTVVRFSWFHLKGYEDCVGTKTDIWFTTVADKSRMNNSNYREVYEHSWQWDPSKDKTLNLLKAKFGDVKKVERHTIVEMQEFIGSTEYFCYSTGAIATFLFLKEYPHLDLYGFDWAAPVVNEVHHYGDQQKRGTIHKVEHEYRFFYKLLSEGKITLLK